jgi:hypothetical protein
MSLVYKGSGSEESNFLLQYSINEEFAETAFAKRPAEFQKLLVNKSAQDPLKTLKKEITILNLRPSFYPLSETTMILQTYENLVKQKTTRKPTCFDFENHKGGSNKLSDLKANMYT